ncbi:MAG: hypothetical protein Q9208_006347 [Pyrenodesmia sp. 3 TL-2023]
MAKSNEAKRPAPKKLRQALLPDFLEKVTDGRVDKKKQPEKGRLATHHLTHNREVDTTRQLQTGSSSSDGGYGTPSRPISAAMATGDRPIRRPLLVDAGFETVGDGAYGAVFSVKVLQKHSRVFFSGPIPAVKKTEASIQRFRQEATHYPVIRSSTVVRCADGKPVLYFIKAGMYAALAPDEERRKRENSIKAIRELINVYPPPPPKADDSRMQKEQREIQKAKHQAFGRHMLAFWHAIGSPHEPPHLSEGSQPKNPDAMAKLVEYMQATEWEHVQIANWIAATDPEIYKELHSSYQSLGQDKLKHLYQGTSACHSGLALLINRTEDPHKDMNDARENWTATNCWGLYEGGDVVYPDLGIKVAQEPGDLSLTRAAVLTHFVEGIHDSERFCHVRFTKEHILRPSGKVYTKMAIPCPYPGCPKVCTSKGSLKTHLHGPSSKARRAKKSPTYHWLPTKEVKKYIARAFAAPAQKDEEEGTGEVLRNDTDEQAEGL